MRLKLLTWVSGMTILILCLACSENKQAETRSDPNHTPTENPTISNSWGKATTKKIVVEEFSVFSAKEGFAYNHHPQVTSHDGKLLATWSSGLYNEDEPGQVMLLAFSEDDGQTWTVGSRIEANRIR